LHRPDEMDFVSGIDEILAASYDEPKPKNKLEAFWQWLVSPDRLTLCEVELTGSPHRCEVIQRDVTNDPLSNL
jgi:hypothetical protein